MNRRQFIAAATASTAAGILAGCAKTPKPRAVSPTPVAAAPTTAPAAIRLESPPVLQNPAPDAVTVVFALSGRATAWVEYGPTPELGQRAAPSIGGLVGVSDRFFSIRVTGLAPGQPFHYRVVAVPVHYQSAYKILRGESVASPVYRATLPSPAAPTGSFAVINDTHQNEPTLKALTEALAADPADVLVYNGDVFNDVHTEDQIVKYALNPAGSAYAAHRPMLYVSGNHELRGACARILPQAFTPWTDAPGLPRCFALRNGPIAMLGLDTGEDKPDANPVWSGLAAFEPYRRAQRDWLAAALRRPEIASAPYLVVFCHIPLWGLPGENGGDVMVDYGAFNRFGQKLWHELLEQAKTTLLVSGHTHRHRYDAPTAEHSYPQLVGGGPKPAEATLIRARADARKLEIAALRIDGTEIRRWTLAPRA